MALPWTQASNKKAKPGVLAHTLQLRSWGRRIPSLRLAWIFFFQWDHVSKKIERGKRQRKRGRQGDREGGRKEEVEREGGGGREDKTEEKERERERQRRGWRKERQDKGNRRNTVFKGYKRHLCSLTRYLSLVFSLCSSFIISLTILAFYSGSFRHFRMRYSGSQKCISLRCLHHALQSTWLI